MMDIKFRDTLRSAIDTGKVQYSSDIKRMLTNGDITQEQLDETMRKFVSGDFGNVRDYQQKAFEALLKLGDIRQDCYGVYGDIIIHYDASRDTLMYVTSREFTDYYIIDWMTEEDERKSITNKFDNARRHPVLTAKVPASKITSNQAIEWMNENVYPYQRIYTTNQSIEAANKLQKEAVGNTKEIKTDLQKRLKNEYRTLRTDDFRPYIKSMEKVIVPDGEPTALEQMQAWSKQYPQIAPLRKQLGLIGYFIEVNSYSPQKAFETLKKIMRNRQFGFFTTDSKEV